MAGHFPTKSADGGLKWRPIIESFWAMIANLLTLWLFVADLFKSRSRLEIEDLYFTSSTQHHVALSAVADMIFGTDRNEERLSSPFVETKSTEQ